MKPELFTDAEIEQITEKLYEECIEKDCRECENRENIGSETCKNDIIQELWRKWENKKEELNNITKQPSTVLNWSDDFSKVQNLEEYLVIFEDFRGDHKTYYTELAWRTHEKGYWVGHSEPIFDPAIMWAKKPDAEKVMEEK